MSTRGFLTFVVDGDEKTSYNHSDSYPEHLGVNVLTWLRDAAKDVPALRKRVTALKLVNPDDQPTPEQIDELRQFSNTNVGKQDVTDWYCLLRETQGEPARILASGHVLDARDFPADSLFAEWGYVIDLDAETFEAYKGFQKEPHTKGRFAGRTSEDGDPKYHAVALVASWPFASLPDDEVFVATVEPDEDDES